MALISIPMYKEKKRDMERKNKIFIEKIHTNFDSYELRNSSIY